MIVGYYLIDHKLRLTTPAFSAPCILSKQMNNTNI